jgi:hypothetical protein
MIKEDAGADHGSDFVKSTRGSQPLGSRQAADLILMHDIQDSDYKE